MDTLRLNYSCIFSSLLSIVLFFLSIGFTATVAYYPEYFPTLVGKVLSYYSTIDFEFYMVRIEYFIYGVIAVIVFLKISSIRYKRIRALAARSAEIRLMRSLMEKMNLHVDDDKSKDDN